MCSEIILPLSPEGSQLGLEPLEAFLASVLMHGWPYPFVSVRQPAVMISCGCLAMKSLGSITLSPSLMQLPPQNIFQAIQKEGSIPSSDVSPSPSRVSYSLLCVWVFIPLLVASSLLPFSQELGAL